MLYLLGLQEALCEDSTKMLVWLCYGAARSENNTC